MRLAALALAASLAAASKAPAADVYILDPAIKTSETPHVVPEIARMILAHRLRRDPDEDAPNVSAEALSSLDAHIQTFGKPRPSLFQPQRLTTRERQLIVLVEGSTDTNMKSMRKALGGAGPAFTIADPPSATANQDLVTKDFAAHAGVSAESCTLQRAMNPQDQGCWSGDSLIVKYDAKKDPETLALLSASIADLRRRSSTGELETTLIMLPETSRSSASQQWAATKRASRPASRAKETVAEHDDSQAFRARDTSVLSATSSVSSYPTSAPGHIIFNPDPATGVEQFADGGVCYQSRNTCMTETFGCFRHGTCKEQVAGCFKCVCGATKDPAGVLTQWTGNMCQKADVSAEFWTFLGVGIITVLALGGGLTMLMNVGAEDLPGVLGAGVVKSK